ncbi:MAG: hypothetical protein K5644_03425 [Lachnospiraceae bacterium]|nr:hypothetical protein [Lachnospiraceae bacterium]
MKKFVNRYAVYIIISLFSAIFIKMYMEARAHFLGGIFEGLVQGKITLSTAVKVLLIAIVIFAILVLLDRFRIIFTYIIEYRFMLGLIIILVCTLLEFSGSSLAFYHNYFGYEYTSNGDLISQGTLLGLPRAIRSDDFATLTTMNFSQFYNDYQSTSDIIRATPTDVTTFYGAPSIAVATLFRPFLWGYILFGSAKGLAFYWASRTVVLFLVSYELGTLFARGQKNLAVAYAILITFSQTLQWWYSTNGLIEMFIFGQLAVVLLCNFLLADKLWERLLLCLGIIYCAGGYVVAYYPAQQIPLIYIYGVLGLSMLIINRDLLRPRHVMMLIVTAILCVVVVALVFYNSLDTIMATMNTVYPGSRTDTGGTINPGQLFYYIVDILTPVDDKGLIIAQSSLSNVCETAVFYSFFPLGFIASLYSMIKRKSADLTNILLMAVEVFFLIFSVIGLPTIIAKITLLSFSTSQRVLSVVGIIDIIILLRSLSHKEDTSNIPKTSTKIIIVLSLLVMEGLMMFSLYMIGYRPSALIWIMTGLVFAWFIYLILRNNKEYKEKFTISVVCIIALTGLAVNPLQMGADVVLEDDLTLDVRSVVETDPDAKWIVISNTAQINNIPITVGAKTINSINTYPNLETWEKIDPDKSHNEVYNRYAHILMDIADEETTFNIIQPDQIKIEVTHEDLETLGVSYIMSQKYLDYDWAEHMYEENGYYIYKVNYY